jgi:hypothetical protein
VRGTLVGVAVLVAVTRWEALAAVPVVALGDLVGDASCLLRVWSVIARKQTDPMIAMLPSTTRRG